MNTLSIIGFALLGLVLVAFVVCLVMVVITSIKFNKNQKEFNKHQKERKEQNIYKTVGNKGIPVYVEPYPKKDFVYAHKYLLPDTLLVIYKTVTYHRVVGYDTDYWIERTDIRDGRCTINQVLNDVLLIDGHGKTTEEYLLKGSEIQLAGDFITYGWIEDMNVWIDMQFVKKHKK